MRVLTVFSRLCLVGIALLPSMAQACNLCFGGGSFDPSLFYQGIPCDAIAAALLATPPPDCAAAQQIGFDFCGCPEPPGGGGGPPPPPPTPPPPPPPTPPPPPPPTPSPPPPPTPPPPPPPTPPPPPPTPPPPTPPPPPPTPPTPPPPTPPTPPPTPQKANFGFSGTNAEEVCESILQQYYDEEDVLLYQTECVCEPKGGGGYSATCIDGCEYCLEGVCSRYVALLELDSDLLVEVEGYCDLFSDFDGELVCWKFDYVDGTVYYTVDEEECASTTDTTCSDDTQEDLVDCSNLGYPAVISFCPEASNVGGPFGFLQAFELSEDADITVGMCQGMPVTPAPTPTAPVVPPTTPAPTPTAPVVPPTTPAPTPTAPVVPPTTPAPTPTAPVVPPTTPAPNVPTIPASIEPTTAGPTMPSETTEPTTPAPTTPTPTTPLTSPTSAAVSVFLATSVVSALAVSIALVGF